MTPDLQNIGLRWRQIRFNPLRSLTPERLAEALDSAAAGWLRQAALIFEVIEQREAIVRSVMTKRRSAVARRDWQVVIPDASNPLAESHKATLEYFYHNITCTDATDLNVRSGMSGLLRQMMDCIIQKYAVHEIIWKPSPDGLTAELRRVPIYFFENRSGKLRFIGPESRSDGMDLDDNGWMITVADGLGEALSICYMYKRLAVQDWLAFSEKFSIPGILGRTSAKSGSPEGNAMRDSVLAYASEWAGVVYSDDGTIKDPIKVVQTTSGGSLPQQELAAYMDKMIAALVRGSDLGTLSQHNSQGASMQANETATLLEDDCALMSETLQINLDRAVIRMVHGDEIPAAYVVINPPSDNDLTKDLAIDTGLMTLGVHQDPSDLAERYGREVSAPDLTIPPAPATNERMRSPAGWKHGGKFMPSSPSSSPSPEPANDPELHAIRSALAEDMQPLGDALFQAVKMNDYTAMRDSLKKISARMPDFLQSAALTKLLGQQFTSALTNTPVKP